MTNQVFEIGANIEVKTIKEQTSWASGRKVKLGHTCTKVRVGQIVEQDNEFGRLRIKWNHTLYFYTDGRPQLKIADTKRTWISVKTPGLAKVS